MRETFPLWLFVVGARGAHVLTRGRTAEEAAEYIARHFPGARVRLSRDLGVDSARWYARNHAFDWLRTPPRWLVESDPPPNVGLATIGYTMRDKAGRLKAQGRETAARDIERARAGIMRRAAHQGGGSE